MAEFSCAELGDHVQHAAYYCFDVAAGFLRLNIPEQLVKKDPLVYYADEIAEIREFDPTLGGYRDEWERLCNRTNSRLATGGSTPPHIKLCGQEFLSYHAAALWCIAKVRDAFRWGMDGSDSKASAKLSGVVHYSWLKSVICAHLGLGQEGFKSGLKRETIEVHRDNENKKFHIRLSDDEGDADSKSGAMPLSQWNWLRERDENGAPWREIFENMKVEWEKKVNHNWRKFSSADALRKFYPKMCEDKEVEPYARAPGRPRRK